MAVTLSAQSVSKSSSLTIVLDPGHGGKDPGALVGNVREKDIVLNVAKKVGEYVTKNMLNTKVIYTRSTDVFIPLHQRAEIANQAKANLFVSIHANACGSPSIVGTETYTLGLHNSRENLEVAKKENSVILFEDNYSTTYLGFEPNSAESYIIFELMQNTYLDQSIDFARTVQNQFRERVGRRDRGVRQAGFLVLRETAMPSALIELGYLTNSDEKSYLASEIGQAYLASAIYRAIKEYSTHHNLYTGESRTNQVSSIPKVTDNKSEDTKTVVMSKVVEEKNSKKSATSPKTTQEISEIRFCVQIGASRTEIKNTKKYFKIDSPISMKIIDGLYKYFVGCDSNYQNCIIQMRNTRKTIKGAFPVAFQNGVPMNLFEARRSTNQ